MNEHMVKSLDTGRIGERMAWDIMRNTENCKSVIDVRDDKRFQGKDVDFLFETRERNGYSKFWWVEVKTDTRADDTGNIVYELSSSDNIGCFEKTEADIIMYYLTKSSRMFVIPVPRFRRYVKNNNFRQINMGDSSTGYLIEIDKLLKENIISELKENKDGKFGVDTN